MMKKKMLPAMLILAITFSTQPAAAAGGAAAGIAAAKNVTKQCEFQPSSNASTFKKAVDGSLRTTWTGKGEDAQTIGIDVGGGSAGGVYFCWNSAPPAWTLYASGDGEPVAVAAGGGDGCLSDYAAIPYAWSQTTRFELRTQGGAKLSIAELSVYSAGSRPPYVPKWRAFSGRVDIMVISAHPDDDQLFLGGVIPTYAEQGKTSVTVFMTYGAADRRFEAMEGVYTAGSRYCPVLGPLRDKLSYTIADARKYWPKEDAMSFLVEQIRKYKPSVIVTHDVNGEYGHGAHKMTAALAQEAFERSGDADYYPESAGKYGAWNPAKLYLHLYNKNKLTLDVSVPLSLYGGKTAFEVAKAGYDRHKSQHQYSFKVREQGSYNIRSFGLCATRVGQDRGHDDMLENVTSDAIAALNPQYVDKTPLAAAVKSAAGMAATGRAAMRFEASGLESELKKAQALLDNSMAAQKEIDAEALAVYAEMERILAAVRSYR